MTKVTGSNNIAGLFGDLMETIESVAGLVEQKLAEFSEGVEGDGEDEPSGRLSYRLVAELGLSDVLVLDDGDWQVTSLQGDGFDADIVSVTLENGESYDLLRTSLVRVV